MVENGTSQWESAIIEKMKLSKQKNGTESSSPQVIKKRLDTRKKNGTMNSNTTASLATRKVNKSGYYCLAVCPHCLKEIGKTTFTRKSTRLNSSHANISYAVFCLK